MGEKEIHIDIDLKHLNGHSSVSQRERCLFEDAQEKKDYYRRMASARAQILSGNIDIVYKNIYQSLFGGAIHHYQPKGGNGNGGYSYHPDVIHISTKPRGRVDGELKAFSQSYNGHADCSVPQVERYFERQLGRLDSHQYGLSQTSFFYGFFRYTQPLITSIIRGKYPSGKRKRKRVIKGPSLGTFSRTELIDFFGQATRDFLLAPPNLFALLLYGAKAHVHPQTSSNGEQTRSKLYSHVRSGDISSLHKPAEKGIEALLGEVDGRIGMFNASDLLLDRLEVVQEQSPAIVINGKHRINPFRCTKYRFKTPRDTARWNRFLRESHVDLLVRTLGIRDLHAEDAEIPI